jgi:predicted membrane-bound spermidine synthase
MNVPEGIGAPVLSVEVCSMIWYFLFFFISGFCGILYEIVWLRLSMAQFGVTSALVSIVLSMFMAGLALGSWASGALMRRYGKQAGNLGLRLYALTELLIGISALLVPLQLRLGRADSDPMVRVHGGYDPSSNGLD